MVGRFVLMWLPDPVAVLQRVIRLLRPRGIVAFQDNDFTFHNLASAPLPLFDSYQAWMRNMIGSADPETTSGPNFHLGLQLARLYQRVGLPPPELTMDTPLGTGDGWLGYEYLAETMAMVRPLMQARGATLPEELDPGDLASHLRAEAVAAQATIVLPAIIGAWSCFPTTPAS